jgi:hypothetical protein
MPIVGIIGVKCASDKSLYLCLTLVASFFYYVR